MGTLLVLLLLALCSSCAPSGSILQGVAGAPQLPYNSSLALQLLHMSGAAYCSLEAVADWSCSFCREVPSFVAWGVSYNVSTDMLAYVGYEPLSDSVVVTFRGTSLTSILDWVEDLNFVQVAALCEGCLLHEGFLAAYYSVRDATVGLVHQVTKAYPQSDVVLAGHSLGGALAYIAAVDLALNEGINATVSYTFGQPRVGNEAFAQAWGRLFAATNLTSYRVTHGADPVPHVPPRLFSFVHPPQEVYYDELNLGHKVCDDSGEDPTCADQWLLPLAVTDHVTYLGIDFVAQWLKCNL